MGEAIEAGVSDGFATIAAIALRSLSAPPQPSEPGVELRTILSSADRALSWVRAGDEQGYSTVRGALESGSTDVDLLSLASIATQAIGFSAVVTTLQQGLSAVQGVRDELAAFRAELVELQQRQLWHLETIAEYTAKSVGIQARILETLLSSRTVEAEQLVRQGYENLRRGFEDEAFVRFQKSLEFDNTLFLPHEHLAEMFEKRGDFESALRHHQRAVSFADGLEPGVRHLAHRKFAEFLVARGRYPEAAGEMDLALAFATTAALAFRRAEMAALARDDASLSKWLTEAIKADRSLFVAALGSRALAARGAVTTQVLKRLDRSLRRDLLSQVDLSLMLHGARAFGKLLGAPWLTTHTALETELVGFQATVAFTPYAKLFDLAGTAANWRARAVAHIEQAAQECADGFLERLDRVDDQTSPDPSIMRGPGDDGSGGFTVTGIIGACVGGLAIAFEAYLMGVLLVIAGVGAFFWAVRSKRTKVDSAARAYLSWRKTREETSARMITEAEAMFSALRKIANSTGVAAVDRAAAKVAARPPLGIDPPPADLRKALASVQGAQPSP